ncbi:MAG: hypothetical protein ACREIC_01875, partial [Limisphaerales bacterium]
MKTFTKALLTGLLLALPAATPAQPWGPPDAGVFPPGSHPYGKTYSEWSAQWWTWFMSLPVTGPIEHPGLTGPGVFDITEGQSGDVWFIGAPFGTLTRSATIPAGKALFIGLLNAEASSLEGYGTSFNDQLAAAEAQAAAIATVFCKIDGVAVRQLNRYEVASPQFTFTAPTPWIFGDTGGSGTSVGYGYY